MIDVCMVVHKNYDYFHFQVEHWRSWIRGAWRLLVLDNTPRKFAKEIRTDEQDVVIFNIHNEQSEFDGVSHGSGMDFLMQKTETPIVGTIDSDFFWLDPNILSCVEAEFASGKHVVGSSCAYDDFCKYVDPYYPERRSDRAPALWGMFVNRQLALEQTFVSTESEGKNILAESGWRLRKRIIQEKIPVTIFQRCKPAKGFPGDLEMCTYGPMEKPIAVHMLKGSMHKFERASLVPNVVAWGRALWA